MENKRNKIKTCPFCFSFQIKLLKIKNKIKYYYCQKCNIYFNSSDILKLYHHNYSVKVRPEDEDAFKLADLN